MMEDVPEGDGIKVAEEDVCVKLENANYSWGFSVDKDKDDKNDLKKL